MSTNWSTLEEFVKEILSFDHPVRTPLSGGTKAEEDVIGINSVSQCKFTEDRNISILCKDLKRLIDAAKLLNKFPIFINQSNAGKTVALPLTEDTTNIVMAVLKLICIKKGIDSLENIIKTIETVTVYKAADKERKRLRRLWSSIKINIDEKFKKIETDLDIRWNDLTSYDLFKNNGEENVIE